jgi:hypothetical protein
MNVPNFSKSETVSKTGNKAAPNIEAPKYAIECFRRNVQWNGSNVSVLYVPLFKQSKEDAEVGVKKYVGPGYWKPLEKAGVVYEKPPFEYNTHEYTKEQLLRAGAISSLEYIWPRS